jgi:hypothetical protein
MKKNLAGQPRGQDKSFCGNSGTTLESEGVDESVRKFVDEFYQQICKLHLNISLGKFGHKLKVFQREYGVNNAQYY